MKQRSQGTGRALIAVWLTTAAGTVVASDMGKALTFDQAGRVTLMGETVNPTELLEDNNPPSGPPNIQCPC